MKNIIIEMEKIKAEANMNEKPVKAFLLGRKEWSEAHNLGTKLRTYVGPSNAFLKRPSFQPGDIQIIPVNLESYFAAVTEFGRGNGTD